MVGRCLGKSNNRYTSSRLREMESRIAISLFTLFIMMLTISTSQSKLVSPPTVCIVGSGIGGSSVAHFLRSYSNSDSSIHIFERNSIVGGRMATVSIGGHVFESGASILHPKNYHALNFTIALGLKMREPPASETSTSLGIWDGKSFLLKTTTCNSKFPFVRKIVSFANSLHLLFRYGFSLFKMNTFVESTVDKFLRYYQSTESRPVFETVEEMLKWAGLYNLTTQTLQEQLLNLGLSPVLINELATVITRINYGQSVLISGLAGAVSLAGSSDDLWSVRGGNWQMASGLLNSSNVEVHLDEQVKSISYLEDYYELNTTKGMSHACQVTVVATPLDESEIQFTPPISIPKRELQHTHATFVRGILNPVYFGLDVISEVPELVATIEDPGLPFTSISVLKKIDKEDVVYKIFSRKPMDDGLLDTIFSGRRETIRINWSAYPHYRAPEVFAPFCLDDRHLYYVNAFENAASTMETSAVAAENIARLILSRLYGKPSFALSGLSTPNEEHGPHSDL